MNESKYRYPRVVRLEDFTEKELELIAGAEVPAEFANLDNELSGWKPPWQNCNQTDH